MTPAAALAAELVKLRTLVSPRVAVAVALAANLLLAVLARGDVRLAGADGTTPLAQVGDLMLAPVWAFAGLGALAAGSEHTGGQLRVSLLAVPDRTRLVLAQLSAVTAASLAAAVVVVVPAYGVQRLGVGGDEQPALAVTSLVATYVLVSLVAASGAVLGRGAVVPLVVLVVTALLAAPMLRATLPTLVAVLPPDAALSAVGTPAGEAALGRAAGLAVLAGWAGALVVAALVTTARRDA